MKKKLFLLFDIKNCLSISFSLPDGRLQYSPPVAGAAFRCHCAHVNPGRVVRYTFNGQCSVRMDCQIVVRNVFEIFLPGYLDVGTNLGNAGQVGSGTLIDKHLCKKILSNKSKLHI